MATLTLTNIMRKDECCNPYLIVSAVSRMVVCEWGQRQGRMCASVVFNGYTFIPNGTWLFHSYFAFSMHYANLTSFYVAFYTITLVVASTSMNNNSFACLWNCKNALNSHVIFMPSNYNMYNLTSLVTFRFNAHNSHGNKLKWMDGAKNCYISNQG